MTTDTIPRGPAAPAPPAQRLHETMAAARVSFTWFGVRKTLTPAQKTQAAETFGAEGQYLSAAKKLLDTRRPAFRAVTSLRNRALVYWRAMSLPYPEPGVRLIRQDRLDQFNDEMVRMRQELAEAVIELDRRLPALQQAARDRLGSLYDPTDYPTTFVGAFAVEWDFPSVEPPNYLLQLNPGLYEQERQRMVARFEEAVRMAEQAFAAEFGKLVSHLIERLSGAEDGRKKIFRNSAVTNLHEFFERFRSLNVSSNEQLDQLVVTAQQALRGVEPQQLRDSDGMSRDIATRLTGVQSQLEGLLVDRPRRRILRPSGRKEAVA